MKDAYGGILNLAFLVVFLFLVSGILGFIVTYTKAFRMKNAIIATIEEYEGAGCGKETVFNDDSECVKKIEEDAEKLHYSQKSMVCDDGFESYNGMFCYSVRKVNDLDYSIVRVVTQVDIIFPIVNKAMNVQFFKVSGDTEPFYNVK